MNRLYTRAARKRHIRHTEQINERTKKGRDYSCNPSLDRCWGFSSLAREYRTLLFVLGLFREALIPLLRAFNDFCIMNAIQNLSSDLYTTSRRWQGAERAAVGGYLVTRYYLVLDSKAQVGESPSRFLNLNSTQAVI
jgi:hypothetical protein